MVSHSQTGQWWWQTATHFQHVQNGSTWQMVSKCAEHNWKQWQSGWQPSLIRQMRKRGRGEGLLHQTTSFNTSNRVCYVYYASCDNASLPLSHPAACISNLKITMLRSINSYQKCLFINVPISLGCGPAGAKTKPTSDIPLTSPKDGCAVNSSILIHESKWSVLVNPLSGCTPPLGCTVALSVPGTSGRAISQPPHTHPYKGLWCTRDSPGKIRYKGQLHDRCIFFLYV